MRPDISVVMAAYNRPEELQVAIQSVAEQTVSKWELIVVDDASNEETRHLLDSITDKRIRVLRHKKNQGPMQSFYDGIRVARGGVIALQDGDDVSLPDRLEKILWAFREGAKVVYHGYYQVAPHPDLGIMMRKYFPAQKFNSERILKEHYIPGPSLSFNRKYVKHIKNHKQVKYWWDWMVILDLVRAGVEFTSLDVGLYEYWRRPDSVSHTQSKTESFKKEEGFVRNYAKTIT